MNTKEKAQWLSRFYAELAENDNGCISNGIENRRGPCLTSNPPSWKVNPKKSELDKLFIGAPVIVEHCKIPGRTNIFEYGHIPINYHQTPLRLPTIVELIDHNWYNKWVAPWPEQPNDLHFYRWLVRTKDNQFYTTDYFSAGSYENVKALQLIGEIKK